MKSTMKYRAVCPDCGWYSKPFYGALRWFRLPAALKHAWDTDHTDFRFAPAKPKTMVRRILDS